MSWDPVLLRVEIVLLFAELQPTPGRLLAGMDFFRPQSLGARVRQALRREVEMAHAQVRWQRRWRDPKKRQLMQAQQRQRAKRWYTMMKHDPVRRALFDARRKKAKKAYRERQKAARHGGA